MRMSKAALAALLAAILLPLAAFGLRGSAEADPTDQAVPGNDEAAVGDQPGVVPSPDQEQLDPQFQRQLVYYRTSAAPGTIVIQTAERFLYLVQGNNRALRYGIGVGRDGFQWQGQVKISRKRGMAGLDARRRR